MSCGAAADQRVSGRDENRVVRRSGRCRHITNCSGSCHVVSGQSRTACACRTTVVAVVRVQQDVDDLVERNGPDLHLPGAGTGDGGERKTLPSASRARSFSSQACSPKTAAWLPGSSTNDCQQLVHGAVAAGELVAAAPDVADAEVDAAANKRVGAHHGAGQGCDGAEAGAGELGAGGVTEAGPALFLERELGVGEGLAEDLVLGQAGEYVCAGGLVDELEGLGEGDGHVGTFPGVRGCCWNRGTDTYWEGLRRMSERSPRENWAKKLTDAIEARLYQRPAKHATVRAAMLLQGEEIVHVDGHLPRTDGADSINGRVVVFTDKSICIIDLAGVASMRAFGADQAGVVNTTVLDRRALKRIEILQAAEGDNAHINSGINWVPRDGFEGDRDQWHWNCRLTLTFNGYTNPVELGAEDLPTFLPGLLENLHA